MATVWYEYEQLKLSVLPRYSCLVCVYVGWRNCYTSKPFNPSLYRQVDDLQRHWELGFFILTAHFHNGNFT